MANPPPCLLLRLQQLYYCHKWRLCNYCTSSQLDVLPFFLGRISNLITGLSGWVFFFWFGIHTASTPITSGAYIDGGAVIRKPGSAWLEGTPTIHVTCLYISWYVVCACSRHALDFKFLFFRSFVKRNGYCMTISRRSESKLLRESLEFT